MADWEHDDGWEDGEAASPTDPGGVEGVRILGAAPGGPRFPLGGDDATWSASAEDREGSEEGGDTSGSMRLPHWTEPPTGEVPRFLPEDDTSDDLESWSTLGGSTPRFRTGAGAWAGSDFQAGELEHDDSTAVGALAEHPEDEHDDLAPPPRTRRERRERRARGAGGRGGTAVADGTTREAPPERGALEGPPRPGPLPRERPVPTGQRVITGLVLAGIALLCFLAGRPVTTVLVTVIVGVAAFELYEALRRAGYHTATVIGLLGCVAIVPIAYDQGERAFPMMIVLVVAFTMLWYLVEVVRARPTVNIALTLMVFGYLGCFGAFGGLLLAPKDGIGYLAGVVICAVGYDIVGWFVGSRLGHTRLARVSPNKTVEGLVAGMIAALALGGFVGATLHPWADGGVGDGLLLGLVVAIMAPIGDLCESMIKRDLGLKDLGTILPGHGGLLDRFDAILFALPAAYYVALQLAS